MAGERISLDVSGVKPLFGDAVPEEDHPVAIVDEEIRAERGGGPGQREEENQFARKRLHFDRRFSVHTSAPQGCNGLVQLGFLTEFQLLARSAGLQFARLWGRM